MYYIVVYNGFSCACFSLMIAAQTAIQLSTIVLSPVAPQHHCTSATFPSGKLSPRFCNLTKPLRAAPIPVSTPVNAPVNAAANHNDN